VAELRHDEAQHLISMACGAVSATGEVLHEVHSQIYEPDGTPAAETQRMLLVGVVRRRGLLAAGVVVCTT
jgi:hypothetical protein